MYDEQFFLDEARVAKESAQHVVPWVLHHLDLVCPTVIDVGCGTGEWLCEFAIGSEAALLGIELYASRIIVPYLRADISGGINCEGWELALCLEVAEHLPETSARPLVAGLAKASAVLFSAATPGQPGVGHIHCETHDYWHGLFAAHGMTPEFIGGQFDEPVASFYRRNMYLYRSAQ